MKNYLMGIAFSLVIALNPILADEEIKITTDEQLQQLPKEWECKWKDPYYSGTTVATWDEEISLKKITGTAQSSTCPQISNNLNAKVKKGKINFRAKHKSPCVLVTGIDTVFKAADGSFYVKGTNQYTYNGVVVRGTQECHPK